MATKSLGCFVIDSSVIIKWFCNEEDTSIALLLREKFISGEIELIAPDLVLYEVANALRYHNTITESDVKDAVESIAKLGITIVVPTKEVVDAAISMAKQYDITVYDGCFVALALLLGYTLITADEKLYTKLKSSSLVTLLRELKENPEKGLSPH